MAKLIGNGVNMAHWLYDKYKDYFVMNHEEAGEQPTTESPSESPRNDEILTSSSSTTTTTHTTEEDTENPREVGVGPKIRGVEMRDKPKGNIITNDTEKTAVLTITRKPADDGYGDETVNLLSHKSIPVGQGDGRDFLTIRLIENKEPRHLAAENMKMKVGDSYIVVWCENDGSAGILLRKRRDPTIYYSVCGDQDFRNLETEAVVFNTK